MRVPFLSRPCDLIRGVIAVLGASILAGCLYTKSDPTLGSELDMARYVNLSFHCVLAPQGGGFLAGPTFTAGKLYSFQRRMEEPLTYKVLKVENGEAALPCVTFTQVGSHLFATAQSGKAFYTYRVVFSPLGMTAWSISADDKELARQMGEMTAAELRSALEQHAALFEVKKFEFKTVQFDQKPVLKIPIEPDYPTKMLREEREGEAVILVQINAEGRVTETSVVRATTEEFGQSAASGLKRRARYKPAMKDGKPVAAAIEVTVKFRMPK